MSAEQRVMSLLGAQRQAQRFMEEQGSEAFVESQHVGADLEDAPIQLDLSAHQQSENYEQQVERRIPRASPSMRA